MENFEMWEPKPVTYTPDIEEVEQAHKDLTEKLFPNMETLNEYPGLQYSLKYAQGNNSWPLIVIGEQDDLQRRLVSIDLRTSINTAKVLEYYLNPDGSVVLTENPTDSTDQSLFKNRIEGVKRSIQTAKNKGILSETPNIRS